MAYSGTGPTPRSPDGPGNQNALLDANWMSWGQAMLQRTAAHWQSNSSNRWDSIMATVTITLPDDLFFTPPEIARLLKFSRAKAYQLVRQGTIPSIRVEGQPRVPRSSLLAYLGGCGQAQ